MLRRFIFCLMALVSTAIAAPFPTTQPVTLDVHEEYREELFTPQGETERTVGGRYQFSMTVTAPLEPTEVALFNEDTPVLIEAGNFSFGNPTSFFGEVFLGDADDYDSTDPAANRKATFIFSASDYNSEDFDWGKITLTWTDTRLTATLVFNTTQAGRKHFFEPATEPDWWVWAYDSAIANAPEPDIDESFGFAQVQFGPYDTGLRLFYVRGSSTVDNVDGLITVILDGGIDDLKPEVNITNPDFSGAGNPTITGSEFITFTGECIDRYRVDGATLVNPLLPAVEIFLAGTGAIPPTATWIPAVVDPNGNWQVANQRMFPGSNYLSVRAIDSEGNINQLQTVLFRYSTKGNVTIAAKNTGFPGADNGRVVGTVIGSGAVFSPAPKLIQSVVGQPISAVDDTRSNVEAGETGFAIAKTMPGAVFDGWTATVDGVPFALPPEDAVKETLRFLTQPKLIVYANFVPNPYLDSDFGTYAGLVSGGSASGRGLFTGKVSKLGSFSGKITIGTLTLPVKGRFLGNGTWTGVVKKKGITYTIALSINAGSTSPRQITGTITGGALNSTIASDLSTWKSKTNEATEYAGNYNILLHRDAASADSVPHGIGFGRITISKVGKVKFTGILGDGSAASCSSTLVRRSATDVTFPLFIPLNKKTGNISGIVTYDATEPETDITSSTALIWTEPVTGQIEPQTFTGQVHLTGARYEKPTGGQTIILTDTNNDGASDGILTLDGPAFTKPLRDPLEPALPIAYSANVALRGNKLDPIPDTLDFQKVKLTFSPGNGFFSGSFFDVQTPRLVKFKGAALTKGTGSAGGVWVRYNRTGAIELLTP